MSPESSRLEEFDSLIYFESFANLGAGRLYILLAWQRRRNSPFLLC
jgi:hypothetical protein